MEVEFPLQNIPIEHLSSCRPMCKINKSAIFDMWSDDDQRGENFVINPYIRIQHY